MSCKSLKQGLIDANGWQRIWFVCSIVCFLYLIIIFSSTKSKEEDLFRYRELWAAEKEMKNPICAPYMSEEFSKLVEPEYSDDGSTCYHIYSHRRFSDDKKPITETIYQQHFRSEVYERWLTWTGIGFLLSTFLTGFVYLVGVVTSWISKGFRKIDSKFEISNDKEIVGLTLIIGSVCFVAWVVFISCFGWFLF